MRKIIFLLWLIAGSHLGAITPSGSYEVFNGSGGSVEIQCGTAAHPRQNAWTLPRGRGDAGSGDHSELTFLRVRYPSGRVIVLEERQIRRREAESGFTSGTWWIENSAVTYISRRDANFRKRAFR
jgi:hypothetical protein